MTTRPISPIAWIVSTWLRSVLVDGAEPPDAPIRAPVDPDPDGIRDRRRDHEHDVLERGIEQWPGTESLLAQDVHCIRGRQRVRDRLQHAWEQEDREGRARCDREQEIRAVDEQIRVA